jgi:predicted Zn-dependent protease with MMP-like domain
VFEVGRERFEELVTDALDGIPDELARLVQNCVVTVEDDSPDGRGRLLGLYQGIPLTGRGSGYTMVLPDKITIFRNPILGICTSETEVVEQVRTTVVHEVGHHFGIDDQRLRELGY